MLKRAFASLAVAFCVVSCSSRMVHSEISPKLAPGTTIDGVPYRIPKRYKATVYEKTEKGDKPLKDGLEPATSRATLTDTACCRKHET